MCRLFGFRSVLLSQVHRSLVSADNALMVQSEAHPDGWGVAYYISNAPHVVKSVQTAVDDQIFKRVSGVVTSQTVLAHLRKSTVGDHSILNTHPFQFGRWTFAHNGNLKNFDQIKNQLKAKIDPDLKHFVLGDTDSELIFYLILTHLKRYTELHGSQINFDFVLQAVKLAVQEVVEITGEICLEDDGPCSENFLSFILTNGEIMLAHQGGKHLYYSTSKTQCPERDSCPWFASECEQERTSGHVNHLILSSEPLVGENVWKPLKPYQIVGVDEKMELVLVGD